MTKDLLSGICQCANCKSKRKSEAQKFKCVDCKKVKNGGYKDKHGPICSGCYQSYGGID